MVFGFFNAHAQNVIQGEQLIGFLQTGPSPAQKGVKR
jgi:hypothetical protein